MTHQLQYGTLKTVSNRKLNSNSKRNIYPMPHLAKRGRMQGRITSTVPAAVVIGALLALAGQNLRHGTSLHITARQDRMQMNTGMIQ